MKKAAGFILYLSIVIIFLSLNSVLYAQDFKDVIGVQLQNGSVIHGKVIQANIYRVIIEKENGERVTVKFDDIFRFIKTAVVVPEKKLKIAASPMRRGSGLYIGANVGLAMLREVDTTHPPTATPLTFKFYPGFALGAVVGYSYDYLRGEAEIMYQKNSLNKVQVGGVEIGVSGDVSNLAFLLNGYLDMKNPSIVTPYLSGGIGVARAEVSRITVTGVGDYTTKSYDDTVFAFQVGAGVGFAITNNVTLDLKYRYFGTTDPKFDTTKVTNSSHNIYLGLRYSF